MEDPNLRLEPRTCPACASLTQAQRLQAERDELAMAHLGKNPPAAAPRPADGRLYSLRAISDEELEAERQAAEAKRAEAKAKAANRKARRRRPQPD